MNIEYGNNCKVKHLKPGDFFMRGRFLYRMLEEKRAQRYSIISERKVKPAPLKERTVDLDSDVTLVYLPQSCEILG